MTRAAAFLVLPSQPPSRGDKDALQANARFLAQSVEDLHLAERVERALRASGYGPLRTIDVTVHERQVTLTGRVPSYYLKQVAQQLSLAVPGAHQVRNDVNVSRARC